MGFVFDQTCRALDPTKPPGGNFDLSHWYLQLPTSNGILTGAAGSVDSASASQLVAGFTNAYFYTGPDGAMTFWTPNNGATTSGSTHPRSELRELLDPSSTSVNWTVRGTHILTATCVVSNVPSDTGKVCIGQMHEPNSKPDGSASANTEHMIMFDLNNQKIYANVSSDGDSGTTFSKTFITGSGVALGKPINYTMSIVDGLLTIIVNSVTNSWGLLSGSNYNGRIFQNWDSASGNTLYFKAGSYSQTINQCNCSTNGARVAFLSLARHHAPNITNQPVGGVVSPGTNFTLTVSASGNGPLTYQWRLNNSSIAAGATNATLLITNVSSAHVGNYTVVVSDDLGAVTSAVAALTGSFPPVIARQPARQGVPPGQTAMFTVEANGTAPLAYRWWSDAGSLTDATNSVLVITNVQSANLGGYFVVVTNAYGAVTSTVATLLINDLVTSTNVVLCDRWLDGARNHTRLPADSAWYESTNGSLTAVTNALIGSPNPAATLTWWTYFTADPANPIHLGEGDILRATLNFTATGINPNNTSRGLRLGVYNSRAGARTLADGAAPNGTHVAGYMLSMNFSPTFGGSGTMQLLERTNLPSGNLIGTVNDYRVLNTGGPASGSAGFSNGVPYTLEYLVRRNAGSVDITATFTSTNGWSASYTATDAANFTSDFDTFVFRPALTAQTATNFTFTEFKVELVATNNHVPLPGTNRVVTAQNTPVSIAVSDLLAAALDLDGDALAITAADSLSTNNGVVTLAGGNLTYTPPGGHVGDDRFSYTLTDHRGAASTGQVFVSVTLPPLLINLDISADKSSFSLFGTGAASQPYVLVSSPGLSPPVTWTAVATNTADTNGVFVFTDLQTTNIPQRFYRVMKP